MRAHTLLALALAVVTLSSCRIFGGILGNKVRNETHSIVRTAVVAGVAAVIWANWTEDEWKVKREEAKQESKGLERYQGPRYKIQAQGTQVAAMPLKTQDVEAKIAFIMDDLLLTELQDSGFQAIGPEDINSMLGYERLKDEAGCDDPECASDVGGALGVPYLTAGQVASVEGSTVVTLKLMNVRDSSVVTRVSRISEGGTNTIPRVIAETVQEMVQKSSL